MRRYYICTAVIISVFLFLTQIGCSGDIDTDTSSAVRHSEQGWISYNSGNYTQALLNFERALNSNPEHADAYNGVGWSQLSLSLTLTLAQESFQNAVRYDSSNADAWIGLANVLYLRNKDNSDFRTAIRAIDNALDADDTFLYRHDYQSIADIYALKAACYFYLGEIQLAIEEIDNAQEIDAENRTVIALQNLLKESSFDE